jgi:UDP-glucose 4-epimerase
MKIVVTGGAGFVGSNLIEELVKNPKNEVYSLDNYFTGKKENHISGATYIEGSTEDIEKLITFKPDLVYHLGEYSRVEASFSDIELVWKLNKMGTFRVLEFCRKHGCKVLYAGSSTKFGDEGLGRSQSPYAWIKATNTELVKNYGVWFGLKYAITYFYNVYGPREITEGKYATVVGIFKNKFKNGEPLPVVSPGTQIRNFTYVGDIVQGLILVGEKGEGDNYALGADKSYSILELAHMFGSEVTILPERPGNRMSAGLDTSRSTGELGWKPKVNLEDDIKDFLLAHPRGVRD